MICFSVALINMLPIGIFDGGKFFFLTVAAITKNEKFSIRHGYVIRELRYTDIFSHFHLLIEETVGIRWLLGRIMLYLSAITLIRKLLLKMKFPFL